MSKRAPKKLDAFATRLLRYMADMGMPEAMSDQEQNQTMRLVAQFAERERRHVRKAIAPAVKELRDAIGEQDRTGTPHQTRRLYGYVAAIDEATKAPRKGRGR